MYMNVYCIYIYYYIYLNYYFVDHLPANQKDIFFSSFLKYFIEVLKFSFDLNQNIQPTLNRSTVFQIILNTSQIL